MPENDSAIESLFELQRNTIKQTEETLDNVIKTTTMFGDAVYQGGVDPQREVGKETIELSRQSIHTSLDAVESVSGGGPSVDPLRDTIDEAFDQMIDQHEAAFYAVESGYDSLGEESVDNLEDQVELLLDLNRSLEERLVEAVEQFAERAEESEEFQGQFQEQVERLAEQFEAQAEHIADLESRLAGIDLEDDDGNDE